MTFVSRTRLAIWAWVFRYIHVALDTFVLYGVLREKDLDERVGDARCSANNTKYAANDGAPPLTLRGGQAKDGLASGGQTNTNPSMITTPV